MHIKNDFRKSVVFLGFGSGDLFRAVGTGFFFGYGGGTYLVTADHIARNLETAPFTIRLNRLDGTSETWPVDLETAGIFWLRHMGDDSVDVAALPFHSRIDKEVFDILQIPSDLIMDVAGSKSWGIGHSEQCYVIGLFAPLAGRKRSVEVVHSARIAAMPNPERIPVRDWRHAGEELRYVDGLLLEASNLQGLSGAPVLVRPSVRLSDYMVHEAELLTYSASVFLLGIWTNSWDAPADISISVGRNKGDRVAVGVGVAAPVDRLIEILSTEEAIAERMTSDAEIERLLAISTSREEFFQRRSL